MKYKLLLLVLGTLTLTACGPVPGARQYTEAHCTTPEERKALAEFIIACATAANPKADEEGEDLVSQCQLSGERALCPTHLHSRIWHGERELITEVTTPTPP